MPFWSNSPKCKKVEREFKYFAIILSNFEKVVYLLVIATYGGWPTEPSPEIESYDMRFCKYLHVTMYCIPGVP